MIEFPYYLWQRRELWWQLTKRDILARYRGSFMGVGWSALNPLLMLGVYTFIFSQVFRARWGSVGSDNSPWSFAINLFAGLIVFNIFAECVGRAPLLVVSNPNYVKKVVFPLEVLGLVSAGSALFQAGIGLTILIVAQVITGDWHTSTIMIPIIWIPLVMGCTALTWILAAMGVFIRDLGQIIGTLISMMMFLSPVFYPLDAVPKNLGWLLALNPLAQVIESSRTALILGQGPDVKGILIELAIAVLLCEVSFRVFRKMKPFFADAL